MKPAWWRLEPALSAVLALAAVGAALVSQHVYDMQPCPWCVLQRLVFVLVAAVALVELAVPPAPLADRLLRSLRSASALSGLAAAVWQHFVASASASCNLTLADRLMATTGLDAVLPDIFQARASCLEAKVWLLGLPYEFWSAALFLGLLGLSAWPLLRMRGRITEP